MAEKGFSGYDESAFLWWEELQEGRHEFIAGHVVPVPDAPTAHAVIALNLGAFLREALRGSRCRAYCLNMKLWVNASNACFYPDAFVTCSSSDRNNLGLKHSAVLIAEVISAATRAYDRGERFGHYRHLPELQEYLLLDSERVAVEVFRKNADGDWELHGRFTERRDRIDLISLGVSVPVDVVYEGFCC